MKSVTVVAFAVVAMLLAGTAIAEPPAPAAAPTAPAPAVSMPKPPVGVTVDGKGSAKIVLTIDVETGAIKVTDGRKALEPVPMEKVKLGGIVDVQSITLIRTHSSPGCGWVLVGGMWYWICN